MIIQPTDIKQSGPGVVLNDLAEGLTVKMSDPVRDFNYALNILTLTYDLSLYENLLNKWVFLKIPV